MKQAYILQETEGLHLIHTQEATCYSHIGSREVTYHPQIGSREVISHPHIESREVTSHPHTEIREVTSHPHTRSREVISHMHTRSKEREGKVMPGCKTSKLGTSDATSSKAIPPKGFITFPDNSTIWRPSVQLHDPTGDISHSNHRSQMILL